MATVNVQPLFLSDTLLSLGEDEFAAAVSSVIFTPAADRVTFRGGRPDAVFSASNSAAWTADITYVQDWTSEVSLSRFLFENEGRSIEAVFTPQNGDAATVTATLSITPGAVGGAIGAHATATVSLGVVGRPVIA